MAFRNLTIGRKLVAATVLTSLISAGLTCLAFLVYDAGLIQRRGMLVAIVLLAMSALAFAVTRLLQETITAPIVGLARVVARVGSEHDYRLRAESGQPDEVGHLAACINELLAQTQAQYAALRDSHAALEAAVDERTRALRARLAEQRTTQQELAAAREEANSATRAKSAFLTTMSEELRTPLDAIIGYAEILEEEAGVRGYDTAGPDLQRVVTAGHHLLSLLDGIVDLSRIEGERAALTREMFQPTALVVDATATVRPLAERRGTGVTLALAPDLGQMWGDPARLRQIVLNLLLNAAKFTEGGAITVSARRIRSGREDYCDWLEVAVADTGIGMSAELIERLFTGLPQEERSTSRACGGAGLGLAISQRFSRLMGGEITVSSELGRGSVFTLTVPASGGERVTTVRPSPAQAATGPAAA